MGIMDTMTQQERAYEAEAMRRFEKARNLLEILVKAGASFELHTRPDGHEVLHVHLLHPEGDGGASFAVRRTP